MSSKRWRISLIKATPAHLIGHVSAPDEESAIKKAIEEFKITDPERATADCSVRALIDAAGMASAPLWLPD
jgi:hypothetical protein